MRTTSLLALLVCLSACGGQDLPTAEEFCARANDQHCLRGGTVDDCAQGMQKSLETTVCEDERDAYVLCAYDSLAEKACSESDASAADSDFKARCLSENDELSRCLVEAESGE